MIRRFAPLVLLVCLGGLIGWCAGSSWGSSGAPFARVAVPSLPTPPQPRSKQSLPHKIVTKTISPQVIAIATPNRPAGQLVTYCAPQRGTPKSPAVLPPLRLSYKAKTLKVWSSLGDGRELYSEHRSRTPFSLVFRDSTPEVTGSRFSWLRDCAKTGVPAGTMGALTDHPVPGLLLGSALGCAVGVIF